MTLLTVYFRINMIKIQCNDNEMFLNDDGVNVRMYYLVSVKTYQNNTQEQLIIQQIKLL